MSPDGDPGELTLGPRAGRSVAGHGGLGGSPALPLDELPDDLEILDELGADEATPGRSGDRRGRGGDWWALAVFVLLVVGAFFVLLLTVERSRWFLLDEWYFLFDRRLGNPGDLFRPHNEHLVTLPVIYYRLVWHVFGMRSYLPYGAASIAAHLATASLLHVIMRRHGVGPWISTAVAGAFVVFGPGHEDILWAFQITFVGGLAFGLAQLLLADHDGPIDRRDWLGLLAGAAALLCSGIGAIMVVVVAITAVLRRSWRVAAFHAAPLGVAYAIWYLIARPKVAIPAPPGQHFTVGILLDWLRTGETSTFAALGHFAVVGAVLAVVLMVGLFVAWVPLGWSGFRRTAAAPAALLVGSVLIQAVTAVGRWPFGSDGAGNSRYIYLVAATTMPALAVAIDALIRRWPPLAPVLVAAVLLPVPWNISAFTENEAMLAPTFTIERQLLPQAAAMPFAKQAPPDAHILPATGFGPSQVTIGWLLRQQRAGKLEEPQPVDARTANGLRVRLGVEQVGTAVPVGPCVTVPVPTELQPTVREVIRIAAPVQVTTVDRGIPSSVPLRFDPANGRNLVIGLPGLRLRFTSAITPSSLSVCQPKR